MRMWESDVYNIMEGKTKEKEEDAVAYWEGGWGFKLPPPHKRSGKTEVGTETSLWDSAYIVSRNI
jgi:hypothetical protein